MLDSLFPYGNIVVFLVLFTLLLAAVILGATLAALRNQYPDDKQAGAVISLVTMGVAVVAYLMYHFIGWTGS